MPEFSLSLSLNVLLLLVGGGALFILAYFSYRTTIPPIPRGIKILLVGLRGTTLVLLLFLLAEPVLTLFTSSEEPPALAVMVDDSKSMLLQDRTGVRNEELLTLLRSEAFEKISSQADLHFYSFAGDAHRVDAFVPESLSFGGDATDLAASLQEIQEAERGSNVKGIIVLSDGIRTLGSSPLLEAERSTVPILTVAIGDSSARQDVAVRSVLTNSITYSGTRVPVRTSIANSGFSNQRVEVFLKGNGEILDRTVVTLNDQTDELQTELSFTPGSPGIHRLTVEVAAPPGDVIPENNRRVVFVKVLESKIQVVMLAGAPSPDVAFVRRALEADANVELRAFIEKRGGTFYENAPGPAELQSADCIVLVGYPASGSDAPILESVKANVSSGTGIFILMSHQLDLEALKTLEPFLPFVIASGTRAEYEAFVSIDPAQRNSPLLQSSGERYRDEIWGALPPLFKRQARLLARPESKVLARVRLQQRTIDEPVLLTRNVGGRKSVALLGYGIWRWRMNEGSIEGAEGLTESFLTNTIRWLSVREDERPVRVEPIREFFTGGYPVEFLGQVYDDNFAPVNDAHVEVEIQSSDGERKIQLDTQGDGQYRGAVGGLTEGQYKYTAAVTKGGFELGRDRGSFSVGDITLEYLEPQTDLLLLRQIADRSGGKFYPPAAVNDLARDLPELVDLSPRVSTSSARAELWNLEWFLLPLIIFLGGEWFIRKRIGLL